MVRMNAIIPNHPYRSLCSILLFNWPGRQRNLNDIAYIELFIIRRILPWDHRNLVILLFPLLLLLPPSTHSQRGCAISMTSIADQACRPGQVIGNFCDNDFSDEFSSWFPWVLLVYDSYKTFQAMFHMNISLWLKMTTGEVCLPLDNVCCSHVTCVCVSVWVSDCMCVCAYMWSLKRKFKYTAHLISTWQNEIIILPSKWQ